MFAAQQFAQVPGAALRCIAGTHREASLACAARFGLADVQRAEVMFAMPDVQLVYIATPPFLHHAQARDALRAGKHVIVEKPLAVTMEQADELVSIARDTPLLGGTQLMSSDGEQVPDDIMEGKKRLPVQPIEIAACSARVAA